MPDFLTDEQAKHAIAEIGRRLYGRGLVAANDGNITVRTGENAVWTTPTGVSKGFMTPDMAVKIDMSGAVLEGALKPSSEVRMHLAVYRRSPEVRAVVHAHPPAASVIAAAGLALDVPLLQESVVALGVVPLAPYAQPGSDELADGAARFCPEYNACLLEHHGAVAWGATPEQAWFRMESLEHTAAVYLSARAANLVRRLPDAEVQRLIALRPSWGVTGGGDFR